MGGGEAVGGGGVDESRRGRVERELGKGSDGRAGRSARPAERVLGCEGDQIEKYLLPCVSGEKHESFALTEPGAGSDIMSMTTRAVRDGDDYIINGAKHFISTPCLPDFAIVFAVTGMEQTPRGTRKGVNVVLVERGGKGLGESEKLRSEESTSNT